jgi:predicted glycosyltransferase
LLYSQDSLSLGHLQRNFKIASRLVRTTPGASALLLTSSPHGLDRRAPPGVDFLKIPTLAGTGQEDLEFVSLRISDAAVTELRACVIQRALEVFEPDVFLVDHRPLGVRGELLPTLEMCRGMDRPPAVVLGLRDIIGAPDDFRHALPDGVAGDTVEQYYDKVLIYGVGDVHPLADHCGFSEPLRDLVTYCGYIGPDEPLPDRSYARADLSLGEAKLIVITGGGGVDAYPMMQRSIRALAELGDQNYRAIALAGPLMDEADRAALRGLTRGTRVEVWDQAVNPLMLFSAADLVVTMGGYNSLTEAVMAGARVLVMPRIRHAPCGEATVRSSRGVDEMPPDREQLVRAQAFATRGLAELVSENASAATVSGCIKRLLRSPQWAPGEFLQNGLDQVERELHALIEERRPTALIKT